jgi:hypothetical protein
LTDTLIHAKDAGVQITVGTTNGGVVIFLAETQIDESGHLITG